MPYVNQRGYAKIEYDRRKAGTAARRINEAKKLPVTASSGNVFADLGFPEPEEELTKAQLAGHIRRILKRRRLTQVNAAAIIGIDQPKVSALLNGRLANFSSGRLMRFLTALGHDVHIVVRPAKAGPSRARRGRILALAG